MRAEKKKSVKHTALTPDLSSPAKPDLSLEDLDAILIQDISRQGSLVMQEIIEAALAENNKTVEHGEKREGLGWESKAKGLAADLRKCKANPNPNPTPYTLTLHHDWRRNSSMSRIARGSS